MQAKSQNDQKKRNKFIAAFLLVNLLAVGIIGMYEYKSIDDQLTAYVQETETEFEGVLHNYEHSFQIFIQMMAHEIAIHPDPDSLWNYLKSIDPVLLEIEGETFDGLYMYYQGRYLYSWNTPYSQYESTGYVATERPWYKTAAAGNGEIVFTPPYMSYANHYILTTLSQMQPDGETVFAYDIKMGDIQKLVTAQNRFTDEQLMIYDAEGTIIGSTDADYLGGNLFASAEEAAAVVSQAQEELQAIAADEAEERSKAEDKVAFASAFYDFRQGFAEGLDKLLTHEQDAVRLSIDGKNYFGYLLKGTEYGFLVLVPCWSMLKATLSNWLIPFLLIELLLVYVLARVNRAQRNQELRDAYVELGQTQKRLEIALSAAQKAAAIDDLTGTMNFKSFRKEVAAMLDAMEPEERGILIMIDGDHFKKVNDTYGHSIGDEVIKLSAQMIIGRIRTVDLASRLHGDEFAIFIANTDDYAVAKRIMEDINHSIVKEAKRRNIPFITLSAGAVIAKHGDSYAELAKIADEALYKAKESHDGGFAY